MSRHASSTHLRLKRWHPSCLREAGQGIAEAMVPSIHATVHQRARRVQGARVRQRGILADRSGGFTELTASEEFNPTREDSDSPPARSPTSQHPAAHPKQRGTVPQSGQIWLGPEMRTPHVAQRDVALAGVVPHAEPSTLALRDPSCRHTVHRP